jgi:hypothetical protein
MLRDANKNRNVTKLPGKSQTELNAVLSQLTPAQVGAMQDQINEWADATGNQRTDFFASQWKTGRDWRTAVGGIFWPLYFACNQDFRHAGFMFGWLVRKVMICRSTTEDWVFYKNPEAGSPELARNMWGTFYWRENRN